MTYMKGKSGLWPVILENTSKESIAMTHVKGKNLVSVSDP